MGTIIFLLNKTIDFFLAAEYISANLIFFLNFIACNEMERNE